MADPVAEQLLAAVTQLRVWRRSDQRAPHKPLLVLLMLGRVRLDRPRLTTFLDIEDELRTLLIDFGPPRPPHPEYPFWHLQTDGIWELPGAADLDRAPGDTPSLTVTRQLEGGFSEPIWRLLQRDEGLVRDVADRLLAAHFPPSIHEDLLDRVGLHDLEQPLLRKAQRRDPRFRIEVLRAYEYRCAVCGYDGRLDNVPVGIDAAHVRWWAAGGPDEISNGLALCVLHHKAFDLGAIGLTEDLHVRVASAFNGSPAAHQFVTEFNGQPLRGPQPGLEPVHPEHRNWHAREVFREPGRAEPAIAADSPGHYG